MAPYHVVVGSIVGCSKQMITVTRASLGRATEQESEKEQLLDAWFVAFSSGQYRRPFFAFVLVGCDPS